MPPKSLSDSHKQALNQGRAEVRAVKAYLDALEEHRPRRGRRRTAESIGKRLAAIEEELGSATSLQKLQLVQERRDLNSELEQIDTPVDLSALEDEFVNVARAYGERKGIAYASWRELGVTGEVLRRAGISPRS
jgi:uncharacterized protein YicC (UPF0701 family)